MEELSPQIPIYFIPFQFRAHFMHMILILAKHMYVLERFLPRPSI